MKIMIQIGIIFGICWISQVIEGVLPFAFPASVIGMILLFVLLVCRILKVEHIREKSDFLLANMAFFFIPAGVSIINYFDVLKNSVVQLLLICVISTVVTFAVTAYTTKLVLWLMNRRQEQGGTSQGSGEGTRGGEILHNGAGRSRSGGEVPRSGGAQSAAKEGKA